MRRFTIATIRSRWALFIGVFVTIATAVALIAACGILLESGLRGSTPPERLAGSPIVVAARQSVSEVHGHGDDAETIRTGVSERAQLTAAIVDQVRRVPGVHAANADLSFPAVVVRDGAAVTDDSGRSWGHPWSAAASTPFALTAGRAPAAPDEVVIDDQLAVLAHAEPGARLVVVTGGEPLDALVTGVAAPQGGPLRQQSALFFTDEEAAARFGHPGQVDAVAVTPAAGVTVADLADRLAAELGEGTAVLTGDRRGRAEFLDGIEANTRLIAISGSLGGIAVAVATFVVASMTGLVVQQRTREMALLRSAGATPRQVRRMVSIETMLVSLPAALVGIVPGKALASWLTSALQRKAILPGTFRSHPTVVPLAIAAASAVLVALGAGSIAGRRAARVHPIEAMSLAAMPPARPGVGRVVLGSLTLMGGVTLFKVSSSFGPGIAAAIAPGMLMTFIVAIGLFSPLIAAGGVRLAGLVFQGAGAPGFLASVNSRANARRLAAAITPLILATSVAGMAIFQQATRSGAAEDQRQRRLVADVVVDGRGPGLQPAAVDEVAGLSGPGASAVGLAPTVVYAGSSLDSWPAQAVTDGRVGEVLDLGVERGSIDDLGPGRVALSAELASELGAPIGEPVRLRLGDGAAVEPVLVATYARNLDFGDVVMPFRDAAEHLTDALVRTVLVHRSPDGAPTDAAVDTFAERHPGVDVGGPEVLHGQEDANASTNAWVTNALLGMVITFVAIAVVNTLMLSVSDRAREYGTLRLLGTTPRQVRRMMRNEALIVIGIGCTVGLAVGAVVVSPYSHGLAGSYLPAIPALGCAAAVVVGALLTFVGTLGPTRLALRRAPVDAIGTRD